MIFLSSLLPAKRKYRPAAERLAAALDANAIPFRFLDGTRDIWLRDFMPVRRGDGKYVSFRYEPSYLKGCSELKTDFKRDIRGQFDGFRPDRGSVLYSDINLDGGNVILSPSGAKAIVSDRLFTENAGREKNGLIRELEEQLDAHVIIIPSDPGDMTGHADGMVRFLDEDTVIGNTPDSPDSLEERIRNVLIREKLRVEDFPCYYPAGISAEGCYLNYLETDDHILLPVFGNPVDEEAAETARRLFRKTVIPVRIEEIARDGGCLNCISWELDEISSQERNS